MSDYIKRESRTFTEIADDLNDLLTELNDKIVESIWAKTADVAPVRHGRWIERCEDQDGIYEFCSECGIDTDITHYGESYAYCPNCGAKMDGDADD